MWIPNYQEGTSYSFPYRGLSWINDLVLVDEEKEEDKVDHSDKGLPVENDNVTVGTRGRGMKSLLPNTIYRLMKIKLFSLF